MCVAAIAWAAHRAWRLVAIGNRDEFHARAAAPLARWSGADDGGGAIIAGRDLVGGGTWLGVSGDARFAVVTNLGGAGAADRASRGAMVVALLRGRAPARLDAYNPFTMIDVAGAAAWVSTNHPASRRAPLAPGLHGLSNGSFDDRWPKTRAVEAALADWLARGETAPGPLLDALRRERRFDREPASPVFVRDRDYGTRCSTAVLVDAAGRGTIAERRYDADGQATGETTLDFAWPARAVPA